MHKSIALLSTAAFLAVAPTALAAPDREGKVGASSPVYNWDGGPGTSIGANVEGAGGVSVGNLVGCFEGIADCEDTLIKVETAGTLTVTTDVASEDDELDLYLYPTNAAGEFDNQAEDMAAGGGAGTSGDEKIVAKVKPGFYMAHVKFFLAQGSTYKGAAVLSGFAAPPAPVTPAVPVATAPPAAEAPASPRRRASPPPRSRPSGPPARRRPRRSRTPRSARPRSRSARRSRSSGLTHGVLRCGDDRRAGVIRQPRPPSPPRRTCRRRSGRRAARACRT